MAGNDDVATFIRSNFRSVWALELLLHLKRHRDRAWSMADLVGALRASDSIVGSSIDSLTAAGLVSVEEEGAAYRPASADLERLADAAETYYARSPDAVRRLIVMGANGGLTAFADAFRLRRD